MWPLASSWDHAACEQSHSVSPRLNEISSPSDLKIAFQHLASAFVVPWLQDFSREDNFYIIRMCNSVANSNSINGHALHTYSEENVYICLKVNPGIQKVKNGKMAKMSQYIHFVNGVSFKSLPWPSLSFNLLTGIRNPYPDRLYKKSLPWRTF